MEETQDNRKPGGIDRSATSSSAQHNCLAHFAEARKIVEGWPEWKKNIGHRLDPGGNMSGPSCSPTK